MKMHKKPFWEKDFSQDYNFEKDIRESMGSLPTWLQPLLTWLTGKALSNQLYRSRTPLEHLLSALTGLILGVTLSSFALFKSGL